MHFRVASWRGSSHRRIIDLISHSCYICKFLSIILIRCILHLVPLPLWRLSLSLWVINCIFESRHRHLSNIWSTHRIHSLIINVRVSHSARSILSVLVRSWRLFLRLRLRNWFRFRETIWSFNSSLLARCSWGKRKVVRWWSL